MVAGGRDDVGPAGRTEAVGRDIVVDRLVVVRVDDGGFLPDTDRAVVRGPVPVGLQPDRPVKSRLVDTELQALSPLSQGATGGSE